MLVGGARTPSEYCRGTCEHPTPKGPCDELVIPESKINLSKSDKIIKIKIKTHTHFDATSIIVLLLLRNAVSRRLIVH